MIKELRLSLINWYMILAACRLCLIAQGLGRPSSVSSVVGEALVVARRGVEVRVWVRIGYVGRRRRSLHDCTAATLSEWHRRRVNLDGDRPT